MFTKSPGSPPEPYPGFHPERLISRTVILAVVLALIFLFTKRLLYSIICLLGSAIALAGFIMTIQLTDRFLRTGTGKTMFFLTELGKIVAIVIGFAFAARYSEWAVVALIAGLSVVILSLLGEGIRVIRQTGNRNGT